ncbi:unnamed protein product [Brachionus calyciflorus]|uniref:Major facilitator superfamily (MFS) profile domain-containing protein n=1 Tax=Brachionus calyciflorus TaxID=104777 RepID=A0A814C977_9BILA|nr:unnamed protein product [Brachionus calyciflorus]
MIYKLIPDKYRKWSTLLGGFLIHLSIGSILTFGNMIPYITSYLRVYGKHNIRYSQTIWIATAYNFAFALSSLFSGVLVSHLNFKIKFNILIGIVLSTLGTCLTYLTIQYSFLLTVLTYGILFGIGSGFSYVGPLSIAMKWFPKNNGFSNSIILFGYGTSSIIFDQIQTMYINPNNLSPDQVFSSINSNEKYFSNLNLLEKIPNTFLILGLTYLIIQLLGFLLLAEKPELIETKTINVDNEFSIELPVNKQNSLGVFYEDPNDGLTLKLASKKPVFWILFFIVFAQIVPCGLVLNFYKTFGLTFISNDKFLSQVGSISALFNALGNFLWGFLIEKMSYKITNLILSTCLVALTSTLYLIQYSNLNFLYAIHVGFIMVCRSGIFVLLPTVTARTFGPKHFQAIYGALNLAGLLSSFVIGELGSHVYLFGWFWLFFTCSLIAFLGWLLAFCYNVKNSKNEYV